MHITRQSLLYLAKKRQTYMLPKREEGSRLTNNISSADVTVQRCGMYHHTCRNRQDARPAV